jgi:hypothetical protein
MGQNKRISLPSMSEVLQFYRNAAQLSAAKVAQAAATPVLPRWANTTTVHREYPITVREGAQPEDAPS